MMVLSILFGFVYQRVTAVEPSIALVNAIIQKESHGDDFAIGDTKLRNMAYGPMQIRQPCMDDVNRVCGTSYSAQDCLGNRELSIWVFHRYMEIYATEKRLGHEPTDSDRAAIWNGGPNGGQNPKAQTYSASVIRIMARQSLKERPLAKK